MRLSKLFILMTSLSFILIANPVSAKNTVTTAEKGALATIAVVDKTEIVVGAVAVNKKTSSGVADYAKMMIDHHGGNLSELLLLAKDLQIKALTGDEAAKISAENMKHLMTLGSLSGTDFDVAYINAMVTGHQAVLDLIDKHLMKTAKTDSVKKFLTDTRAAVVQHLADAKKLQEELRNP